MQIIKTITRRNNSAARAKERLKQTLAADRAATMDTSKIEALQADVLRAVKRHIRSGRIVVSQGIARDYQMLEIVIDPRPKRPR